MSSPAESQTQNSLPVSGNDASNVDTITPAAASAPAATAATSEKTSGNISRQPSRGSNTTTSEGEWATATRADNSTEIPDGVPDPMQFGRHRRHNTSKKQMAIDHPAGNKRKLSKFYTRQNQLIDQFLGADDEERLKVEEDEKNTPKVKFAIWASFVLNLALFLIQLYAAISTGSLALFATATDAFMDFVSSLVMLITARMASRPSVYKYPVGRTRIETIGVILFCCLMTTVAVQLLIESGRRLAEGEQDQETLHVVPIILISVAIGTKASLMLYCLFYRQYPSVHVFYIDHRNDIAVNSFGLIMAVVGDKFIWYLDPIGAIVIALIILFSWVSNAFEQVWLLVGKSAPRDFLAKLVYMSMCHDERIVKVDTCRAYHAGQRYYVEIDIVMDEETPLRISHDVAQALQRKVEGLGDVERAFVHVDYEHEHDIHEEHKPLYEKKTQGKPKRSFKDMLLRKKEPEVTTAETSSQEAETPRAPSQTKDEKTS